MSKVIKYTIKNCRECKFRSYWQELDEYYCNIFEELLFYDNQDFPSFCDFDNLEEGGIENLEE